MEKIKNYNQIILAIAGTVGVVLLMALLVMTVEDFFSDFFISSDDSTSGILAIEETNQLNEDSLRKQIISFNRIQVVDSLNQTYILPVTQANLADAESTGQMMGLLNTTKGSYRKYDKFYGNIYNNLMIHNALSGESIKVFDHRISIENFIIHESDGRKYIVIPGCSVDSNKDKFLNSDDLQELFIYDLHKKQLTKIMAAENYTTLRAYQPDQSNDLIVHFGIDRNRNGVFESSTEPMIFYKIDLQNMKIVEFVNENQINELQKLLEGN